MADSIRLPTFLWLDGQLRSIEAQGCIYCLLRRGEQNSGVVCVKMRCRQFIFLYQQERDFNGVLGWRCLTPKGQNELHVEEKWVDDYIARACARDPDLWIVEIETQEQRFPLEGPVFI